MKSSPTSYASTGLCKWTLGSPGMAPSNTSSMLGCVAAVIETESPSQPRPAVIQTTWISCTAGGRCVLRPYGAFVSGMGVLLFFCVDPVLESQANLAPAGTHLSRMLGQDLPRRAVRLDDF